MPKSLGYYIETPATRELERKYGTRLQDLVIREISAERAKAEYEAVAHYEVPKPNERGLDLAELRRQRFKRVGMRAARQMGLTRPLAKSNVWCFEGLT